MKPPMESTMEPPLLASSTHQYYPLVPHRGTPYVIPPLLHYYHHRRNTQCNSILTTTIIVLLLLLGLVYFFWPYDPKLQIVRLHLRKIHVRTFPIVSIDIHINATIRVRNADVYSVDLNTLDVSLKYRGKQLGHVKSKHGHVRPLSSSYVSAELEFNGVRILGEVVPFLEDLAKGVVPFDTVTKFRGQLGFLFFCIPLKATLSCEIKVNTKSHTIIRQNCYPFEANFIEKEKGHEDHDETTARGLGNPPGKQHSHSYNTTPANPNISQKQPKTLTTCQETPSTTQATKNYTSHHSAKPDPPTPRDLTP